MPEPPNRAPEPTGVVEPHPLLTTALGERLDPAELADVAASLAPATWRAYRPAFTRWTSFAQQRGEPLLPPTAEAAAAWVGWLLDEQGLGLPTVRKHVAALSTLVDLAVTFGQLPADTVRPSEFPRVRRRLSGRARTDEHRPSPKRALTTDEVVAMVAALRDGRGHQLRRRRDTALILLGFAGAFRRSELAALQVEDLVFRADGYLEVHLRRSKTDQEGAGRIVGIAPGSTETTCPVRTVRHWFEGASIDTGPVFRPVVARAGGLREFVQPRSLGPRSIAQAVKDAAARTGIPPEEVAGHSLRRGHVTVAVNRGATDGQISATTGQSRTTIDGYTAGRHVTENSSRLLGL